VLVTREAGPKTDTRERITIGLSHFNAKEDELWTQGSGWPLKQTEKS
jgi:hypothetical protein